MEQLWAPWRLEYILNNNPKDGCIFCEFPKQDDDKKNHILLRGEYAYVIMNAFPYSNGHLLVPPYRHIHDICELTDQENLEIMQLTAKCCRVLKEISMPDGFNVGMNIGAAAGAGIADHLHLHIVPRWKGDTNFMAVLSDVKVIPEALDKTYDKLKNAFDGME